MINPPRSGVVSVKNPLFPDRPGIFLHYPSKGVFFIGHTKRNKKNSASWAGRSSADQYSRAGRQGSEPPPEGPKSTRKPGSLASGPYGPSPRSTSVCSRVFARPSSSTGTPVKSIMKPSRPAASDISAMPGSGVSSRTSTSSGLVPEVFKFIRNGAFAIPADRACAENVVGERKMGETTN